MQQHRWLVPFGHTPIQPGALSSILSSPIFNEIDPADFPDDLPLSEIIANDGRILRFGRNEMIFNQGDYGNSVFVVLCGQVRCLTAPDEKNLAPIGLPDNGNSWLQSFPDFNDLRKSLETTAAGMFGKLVLRSRTPTDQRGTTLGEHEMFGVSAALRRAPKSNSVIAAEDNTLVLELRWSGVRDLRFWSNVFRARMDELYQRRSCMTGLRQCALFSAADDMTLQIIAENSVFETFGELGWSHRFQRRVASPSRDVNGDNLEPIISDQGEQLQGLLIMASGFVRVSHKINQDELTLGFLTRGDVFGLDRLIASLNYGSNPCVEYGLRACGYADVIWIPQHVIEIWQEVDPDNLGTLDRCDAAGIVVARGTGLPQSLLDFIVENRFVNGTSAMVINTDRCVNCDDCVRACAATHDDVPQFVRHGKSHHNLMVVNACMHCTDPVCMIDCPTDAIRRDTPNGNVVIDNATCIGCGACANACPYENIRMEKFLDPNGAVFLGEDGFPSLKATKCDLCAGQRGGPACKRACPHDAISRINMEDTEMLSKWPQVAQ